MSTAKAEDNMFYHRHLVQDSLAVNCQAIPDFQAAVFTRFSV